MALTQISTGMLASGDGTVDLNIDNGTFVVDVSTSRVGIGNSSPSVKLDVTGAMALSGNADFNGNLDVSGTLAVGGVLTANAGVVVDNFTLDGTTLALSSGDLTLDVAGSIIFDADGADYFFKNGGVEVLRISGDATPANVTMRVMPSDGDFIIKGNDGGSTITALTLDMSDAGNATFNNHVNVGDGKAFITGASSDFQMYHLSGANVLHTIVSDADMTFKGNDGGSTITALTLDMSAAGAATFNSTVTSAVGQGSTAFYANVAGSYQQFNAASSNAWALGATGGNTSPATAASTTFGFHNWNGSAWSNPLAIAATGDLTGTSNTTGLAASFLNSHADGYGMRVTTYSNAAQYGFAVDSYGGGYSRDFTVGVDGNVNVLTGNLVIATAGKGIDFSATAGAGTSELLDDYEEGTWTPKIEGDGTTASGQSYTTSTAKYTKIGSFVFLTCDVSLSALGTTAGSYAVIKGLPFSVITSHMGGGSVGYYNGITNNSGVLTFYANGNQAYLMTGGAGYVARSDLTNTSRIICTIIYQTGQ